MLHRMDMKDAMAAAMREYLLPELEGFKSGLVRITVDIAAINTRLDDVNQHLADQSRRTDAARAELNASINAVREEVNHRIDETNHRMDATNKRLDRLYEVIVRRDEHSAIVIKLNELDHEVREIKQLLAV